MRKCSRVGMERTTTKVRRMVDGVGSRREEIMADIFAGDIFPSLPLSLPFTTLRSGRSFDWLWRNISPSPIIEICAVQRLRFCSKLILTKLSY